MPSHHFKLISIMSAKVVIPGDSLSFGDKAVPVTVGPGVYKDPQTQAIEPSSAGILNTKESSSKRLVYIDSNSKRYIPQTNDFVIGIITGVFGENYKVQLQNFSSGVLLSMMAFPNASRKNKPNLKVGQAVYARVSQAIPEIDIELECIDATTGKEGGFGLLDESGYLFDINMNFARELLFNPNSHVLEKLASKCRFEIAVGINGKVWIKCGDGVPLLKEGSTNDDTEEGNSGRSKDSYINDLKTTLAASRYLLRCQEIPALEVDAELEKSMK